MGRFPWRLLLACLCGCLAIIVSPPKLPLAVSATEPPSASPATPRVVPPQELDSGFQPELGTYAYDVLLAGVQVGEAYVTIAKDDEYYQITVQAQTNRAINLVYNLRYLGQARVIKDPFTPVTAEIKERSGRRKKDVAIDFQNGSGVKTTSVVKKGRRKAEVAQQEYSPEAFGLDPFSAVCLIRRLEWEPGLAVEFHVFTGNRDYVMRFTCQEAVDLMVAGRKRQAWVIIPRRLDKAEGKRMRVFVSRDGNKEILKIVGHARVGDVTARLHDFQPAGRSGKGK
ncbi:MAG: DUF3108 domain-containing protein [Thermodesulfobacteriota bacterium]